MFPFRARELVVSMAVTAATISGLAAQEQNSAPSGPAPILMTVSEVVQPGAEAAHARLEAEYAATLEAGQGSQFYLGMEAITGAPQMVFLSGYASLEEMADVHDQDEGALGEKLAGLEEQHSATLAGTVTAIWRLRPELSNPNTANLAAMRYMDVIHIHVKLGHSAEFAEIIKNFKDGWMKADPDFHYSLYQQIYGGSMDDSYMLVIAVKSLADLDKHHSLVPQFRNNLGEDARKRMHDFESTSFNSIDSNLFAFAPSMSRLPQSWTKGDADFWNPQPAAAVPAKKTEKAK
jgi:hypothetical protein